MPTSTTEYRNLRHLRQNLHPKYARWSDQRVEALLEKNGIDAEAMEGFFDDLGKFASGAGKTILQAAPSILPVAGQVIGTVYGGPAGAAIGGSLGSLAGQAISGATGQKPSAPQAGGSPAVLGGLLTGGLGGSRGSSPAAGQLLQTVLKPETLQALMSMAMGSLGKPNVEVGGAGGTSVPVGAFGNLLKVLSGRMEAEYDASIASSRNSIPEYMQDFAGDAKADPAVAENRAAALYELLESSESERESSESAEAAEAAEYTSYQSEMEAVQAEYDAIELMEAYESEDA